MGADRTRYTVPLDLRGTVALIELPTPITVESLADVRRWLDLLEEMARGDAGGGDAPDGGDSAHTPDAKSSPAPFPSGTPNNPGVRHGG